MDERIDLAESARAALWLVKAMKKATTNEAIWKDLVR